jgi:hypothetical protein
MIKNKFSLFYKVKKKKSQKQFEYDLKVFKKNQK